MMSEKGGFGGILFHGGKVWEKRNYRNCVTDPKNGGGGSGKDVKAELIVVERGRGGWGERGAQEGGNSVTNQRDRGDGKRP